ncbi:MAG: hypothetical protein JMN27_16445 [gamma proteobacterium endosymbiont of Lamellibrachia anaximandri]|nr:hypothetical protein [gamma proteobacterium endosymbiont of Lamellibrachia anaximandri]MBL3535397.1 hypothetical protein [gamma proteobacterium endosymbiont of Lamellibrachia anaximandri]
MPIIDKPISRTPIEPASPAEEVLRKENENAPTASEDVPQPSKPKVGRSSLLLPSALALVLGILLPLGSYYLYGKLSAASRDKQEERRVQVAEVDISMNLERLVKIGSLTSLSKKEFEVNVLSLIEAEKIGGAAVLSALEIVVNKKRQDLVKYKDKLIALLMELNHVYSEHSDSVEAQFNKAIAAAEGRDSSETVRLLKMGLKVLEGSPRDADIREYMKVAIEDRL